MFEKYNESARRVIFFARYEASQFGSLEITTEQLLLGLLREAKSLMTERLGVDCSDAIREAIRARAPVGKHVPESAIIPLSQAAENVLQVASHEAERLKDEVIGPEHLLLGLLSIEKSTAAQVLGEFGLDLAKTRDKLREKQS